MTETYLAVAINELIKNHDGPPVNLTVKIMSLLKEQELFVHSGNIRDIIEIDMEDSGSEYWTYKVYVEPIEDAE